MSVDPYYRLCLTLQAIRRQVEGHRSPLIPALGIAADLFPHQTGNVYRVLSDVCVRHLLADEVGLGKTVQALMVLNALHHQTPSLRALVVVPDQLVTQWRDEIMTRAHSTPIGESDRLEGNEYIRLLWEAQFRRETSDGSAQAKLADIDPAKFDILVVDELHRLRSDLQNRIVRVAPAFQHLLVLTATPAFQKPARHAQLFALLEPERTANTMRAIAESSPGRGEGLSSSDDLSTWPDWAAQQLIDAFLLSDQVAAETGQDEDSGVLSLVHGAYRRVLRTRRADYPQVLPRRNHIPIRVKPLGDEVDRQELMWEYFSHLDSLSRQIDPVKLAKRVVLSPPSLEQRVDFLRRFDHDREGLLTRVKPLVHRSRGDSRADALLDLLHELWEEAPEERVLVAAQDNLTVDYLHLLISARLPTIGPLSDRRPLRIARIRQGMATEAVHDLGGMGNETYENLEEFQRGAAQLLLAPEVAQAGLNLQCARLLVLYSVPWRPEEVEQWIGRLDRIGNTAVGPGTKSTIEVYTIVQEGLVDHRVVDTLKSFSVFERGVNLDGDHLDEVATLIESAALDLGLADWTSLESRTQQMAAEDAHQELHSPLQSLSPWTPERSLGIHKWLMDLEPLEPLALSPATPSLSGPHGLDRAFEPIIALLKAMKQYAVRWNTDPMDGTRFQSLWYRFGERGMYGHREVESEVLFSFGADPGHNRSVENAHTFITRRSDLRRPPRRHVTLQIGQDQFTRPRRFLNFGDPLHDELLEGWAPQGESTLFAAVTFFDRPSFWQGIHAGLYLVDTAELDPASLLDDNVWRRALQSVVVSGSRLDADGRGRVLEPVVRSMRTAFVADQRWVRSLIQADHLVAVSHWTGSAWTPVAPEVVSQLLSPLRTRDVPAPRGRDFTVPDELHRPIQDELSRLESGRRSNSREAWSHRRPMLSKELHRRLAVLEAESREKLEGLEWEVARTRTSVVAAELSGNPGQITRSKNQLAAAEDRVAYTRCAWEQRMSWLEQMTTEATHLIPRRRLSAVLRVDHPLA